MLAKHTSLTGTRGAAWGGRSRGVRIPRVTKDEARAWVKRWEAVEERQLEELRRMTMDEKFEALAYLMASADLFDMSALEAENAAVREMWVKLKSIAAK